MPPAGGNFQGTPPEPSEAGPVGRGGRNGAGGVLAVRRGHSRAEFLPTTASAVYSNQLLTRLDTKAMAEPRQKPVISVVRPTVDPSRKPRDKIEMSHSMRIARALSLFVRAATSCGMAS